MEEASPERSHVWFHLLEVGGSVVKNLPAHEKDMGSITGAEKSHMLWSNQAPASQLLSSPASPT